MSSQQNGPVTGFREKLFEGTEDVLKRQVPTAAHAGLAGIGWWEFLLIILVFFLQNSSSWDNIYLIWDSGSFHVNMQIELSLLLV